MQEINDGNIIGKIVSFNGQFGFIKSNLGETFFHKTSLLNDFIPQKNDNVEFQIKPSKQKENKLEAYKIVYYQKELNDLVIESEGNYLVGVVKWFDSTKGFGFITSDKNDYYIHKSNIEFSSSISENDIVLFLKKSHNGKLSAIKCKEFAVGLFVHSTQQQKILLLQFLNLLGNINNANYPQIKSIAQSENLNEGVKFQFVKDAFDKANAECQYKIMFEDNLIEIKNESEESQIEILGKLEILDIDKIISILQSNKIVKSVTNTFLISAFDKASASNQFKILFEYELINIQKVKKEIQIVFLQKYLIKLGNVNHLNYYQIKHIAQSKLIEDTVKYDFLKHVYNKASFNFQFDMFLEELVIITSEEQAELLKKYLSYYDKIDILNFDKIITIAKIDNIKEDVKIEFLETTFKMASIECQYKMLIDEMIKLSEDRQIKLFKQYLFNGKLNNSKYDKLKEFSKYDTIEANVRSFILEFVYEKTTNEFKFKMLIDELVVVPVNNQIEFLMQYINQIEIIDNLIYYERIILIISKFKNIENFEKETFFKLFFEKMTNEYQLKMYFNDLIILSQDKQIELLTNYLARYSIIHNTGYENIKSIFLTNKFDTKVISDFIYKVFEKGTSYCKYKIIFEDNLIDIQNEIKEYQNVLLQKYIVSLGNIDSSNFNQIKSIANSNKIEESIKNDFLKTIFEKANSEYKYKLLFEDNLIDIQKENFEIQSYLLQKLEKLVFEKIKIIYESDKIEKVVLDVFLKSTFEKASFECKFKMLFDGLIILSKVNLSELELLSKYLIKLDCVEISSYETIKLIYKSNKIEETAKSNFIKSVFKIASFDFQNKMIFIDRLIEYSEVSKIDRLRLWLHKLNPHYNYLEFVQASFQLSNDERKLLNKRLKEYANDERLEFFIKQIPKAELIEETDITKTYKCKWRNLYYKDGSIQVFLDKETSTNDYIWESSREEWNLLTQEYFNNRSLENIIITVNKSNEIIEIIGLENIEVQIVLLEVRKKNGKKIEDEESFTISNDTLVRIIHNVAARNQCINFLSKQSNLYKVIDIQELLSDKYGSLSREISFLFSIPNTENNIYLIWESAEFEKSKATHIFKCTKEEFNTMESKIKTYIEENTLVRSKLNSVEYVDIEIKKELQYYCKVNHHTSEYQVWEDRMREVLPFFK